MEFYQTLPTNPSKDLQKALQQIPNKWEIGGMCPTCNEGTLELIDKGDDLKAQKPMHEWGDGKPSRFVLGCTNAHSMRGEDDVNYCTQNFTLDRRPL